MQWREDSQYRVLTGLGLMAAVKLLELDLTVEFGMETRFDGFLAL